MPDAPVILPVGFLSLDIPGNAKSVVRCGSMQLDVIEIPERPGRVEVPLPGWIWHVAGSHQIAWICWDDCAFPVSRTSVQERLHNLAANPVETCSAAALVGALEHFHYGALQRSDVDPDLQSWLREAASSTGLSKLISEPFVPPPPSVGQMALAEFGAALPSETALPSNNADLDIALARAMPFAQTPAEREALLLAVMPEFCRADQVQKLVATISNAWVELPWKHDCPSWAYAQALVIALLDKNAIRSEYLAREIAASPADWVSTPTLAWALRHPFTKEGWLLPASLRQSLVDSLTRFAEARAPLSCREMIRSSLALLDKGLEKLPSNLAETVVQRVLRSFGTSPLFWEGIATLVAAGRPVPAEFLVGQKAFSMLLRGMEITNATRRRTMLTTGLRRLRSLGVADIERLEIELLSNERLDDHFLNSMFCAGSDGALNLLRNMMAPQAERGWSQPDATILKALRWANSNIPDAPLADVQRHAFGLARSLTAPAAPDALPGVKGDEAIESLIPLLAQLAGSEAQHCGLGIAFALLADLASEDSDRSRMLLLRITPEIRALLKAQPVPPSLAGNPFLLSSVARLRAAVHIVPNLSPILAALPPCAVDFSVKRPPGLPHGPALIDTLVVVVSCHANLDTRVAAQRRGWLTELTRMGVPHIILVGGDRTHLTGDILEVAAPDTYESLPKKIIAMLNWVKTETDFAYVLKIDDDCHVDPVAWFGDALWRQTDWYGRRLDKSGPLAQRDWHQSRAQSEAARLSFEALPHEGIYTDGSTGYALSRQAIVAITEAAAKIEGRRMIARAFSEDRLIGALLTSAGFVPNSANYHSLILRRFYRDGLPVPLWAEGVMPNDRLRHTKVLHCDDVLPLEKIENARRSLQLSPPRLWPANRSPGMGYDNGSFHLVSSQARLDTARQTPVAVISVVRNERIILPHFLEHYRKQGIDSFMIVDNLSDDGTLEYLTEQPDVTLFSAASQFRTTDQGTDWKLALMGQLRLNRWSLIADADEFLLLPKGTSLPSHVRQLHGSVNAQRVLMQDMYPRGSFAQADFSIAPPFEAAPLSDVEPFLNNSIWRGPFSDSETLTSALRHRMMPGSRVDAFVAQKTPLVRYMPWMRFSTSLHYAAEVIRAPDDLVFAHFKYNAHFANKAVTEVRRGQYWNNAEEYNRYRATGFAADL